MTAYFIRRFLLIVPTFIGITLLVFCVTRFVPGGPIERMVAQMQMASAEGVSLSSSSLSVDSILSEDQLHELEVYYGFDKPVFTAYWLWLVKIVQLDLGSSSRYNEPVWGIIKDKFPVSIFYGVITMILTYAVCIPLGIAKATRHNTLFDNVSSSIVFIGYAIPGYVVGIAALTAFASYWDVFPLGSFVSEDFAELSPWGQTKDLIWHAVLPLLAYMAGSFAVTTFMMKNALMENLAADYVRTAIAKGLSFRQAVFRHALRNSLIPIATSFGGNISLFLTGSFLIETIFNIDGFGLLGYESLLERDFPVVLGILVISSLLFLLGNILSDICVALVDPRVKFGEATA